MEAGGRVFWSADVRARREGPAWRSSRPRARLGVLLSSWLNRADPNPSRLRAVASPGSGLTGVLQIGTVKIRGSMSVNVRSPLLLFRFERLRPSFVEFWVRLLCPSLSFSLGPSSPSGTLETVSKRRGTLLPEQFQKVLHQGCHVEHNVSLTSVLPSFQIHTNSHASSSGFQFRQNYPFLGHSFRCLPSPFLLSLSPLRKTPPIFF
jgi:hypothetical protein